LTPSHRDTKKAIYLVLGCTVFSAAGQVLMKFGAGHPMPAFDLTHPFAFVLALLGNLPLLGGYAMSAGTALLMILALRHGELSVLFPIISMSYVWVSLLSIYFFGDQMNLWKAAGIALVIWGVAMLGRAGSRT
jgi:multidrug transporter EmrE-like cation transporter